MVLGDVSGGKTILGDVCTWRNCPGGVTGGEMVQGDVLGGKTVLGDVSRWRNGPG